MPAYKHLYTKEVDFDTAYATALTQKKVFNVPYDEDMKTSVKLGSIQEAKEQFIKDAAEVIEDMKNESTASIFDEGKGKITEIVALIAYMNSLGSSRIVK